MENYSTFFLHIDSANLGYYFDYACIYPYNYYEKPTPDFQKVQKDFIILSSKKWNHICDCSIEVIITEAELKNLISTTSDEVFFYSKPIPISRIKNIYFVDFEIKERITFYVNVSTAFIPEHLIKVQKFDESEILKIEEPIQLTSSKINWGTEQSVFFDQILGGFSLLSISGKAFQNYADKYFILLSFFNTEIKSDYEKYCGLTDDEIKLWQIFLKNDSSWKKKWSIFFDTVNNDDIYRYAQENMLSGKIGYIGKDIKRLNASNYLPSTYALILLSIYGRDKNFSIDELISVLKDLPSDKVEFIALFFGINNGYSRLEKKYPFVDKYLKFRMNSLLDYYTIESIYQFAFNNIAPSGYFEYIHDAFQFPEFEIDKARFSTYKILDVTVIQNELNEAQVLSRRCTALEVRISELERGFLELGNKIKEITKAEPNEDGPREVTKKSQKSKAKKNAGVKLADREKNSNTPGLF